MSIFLPAATPEIFALCNAFPFGLHIFKCVRSSEGAAGVVPEYGVEVRGRQMLAVGV